MEFTEVPPSIWPCLNVVARTGGTLVLIKRTELRAQGIDRVGHAEVRTKL